MTLKFGTSGIRGLVEEMTDRECALFVKAFTRVLKEKTSTAVVALAGDHRSSTPRICRAVAFALGEEGLDVDDCGFIATPAVMLHGLRHGTASIMVTGSHIPDDRNGIKFNFPWGEVLKGDEQEILERYAVVKSEEDAGSGPSRFDEAGGLKADVFRQAGAINPAAEEAYRERFTGFFPARCLEGLKVVLYQHSSVSRGLLHGLLSELGADVVPVGRSDTFVPVDTEAVAEPEKLAGWVREHAADALVSTDGDGDRPLVVDERGRVVRGDLLGLLVADALGADSVSTPVSCNTAIERSGRFPGVTRTRIGSPYVIAAMNEAVSSGRKTVMGFEANGGFLTATDVRHPRTGRLLVALPTRDAVLPILTLLELSIHRGRTLSELVRELPSRFTGSGILKAFPPEVAQSLVEEFEGGGRRHAEAVLSPSFGPVESLDFTDGVRVTFASGNVVHLRRSGNAPEFRCYTEAGSEEEAQRLAVTALELVLKLKGEKNPA